METLSPPTVVIRPPSVAEPLPLDEIFDPGRPLEVDLGCGKGRFLLARAVAHPEMQFLGIDRMLVRIRMTQLLECREQRHRVHVAGAAHPLDGHAEGPPRSRRLPGSVA